MNREASILDEYYHALLTLLSLYGWKIVLILSLLYLSYYYVFEPYIWKWIQKPFDQQRKQILDKHKIQTINQLEKTKFS